MQFLEIIREGKNIQGVHIYKKSYITFISLFFADGSYLELDLIHRIERKGIIFLNTEEIIKRASKNKEGIKIASLACNFEYIILFYLINGASVPEKYISYFGSLTEEGRREIFAHISTKHTVHLNVLDELFNPKERNARKIVREVYQHTTNRGAKLFFHKIRYLSDVYREMIFNKGIVISFSGVDGAGKSTVIEQVENILQKKYRQKTVVLRHRPGILPILSAYRYGKEAAEKRTTQQLPRQGKNENSINSFFRFLYYYTDYFFGQYYIYFHYTLKGYTVLYDRFYFDFIIDAKRSNIVLPKPLVKIFYFFLFKPEVNIFLYAPTEQILHRKKELSVNDIQQLTHDYRLLFENFADKYKKQHYVAIDNIHLDTTLNLVIDKCISASF